MSAKKEETQLGGLARFDFISANKALESLSQEQELALSRDLIGALRESKRSWLIFHTRDCTTTKDELTTTLGTALFDLLKLAYDVGVVDGISFERNKSQAIPDEPLPIKVLDK